MGVAVIADLAPMQWRTAFFNSLELKTQDSFRPRPHTSLAR